MAVSTNQAREYEVDGFGPYSEGRRVAWKGRDYFHTDNSGRRCYDNNFLYVGIYDNGLAPALQQDGSWCYIDMTGIPVIAGPVDYPFEYAGPFIGDRALIIMRGQHRYILRNEFRVKRTV